MNNREPLPTILGKCKLDVVMEATIFDSGRVLLTSAQHGVEVVLKPEQVYALLELLYVDRRGYLLGFTPLLKVSFAFPLTLGMRK